MMGVGCKRSDGAPHPHFTCRLDWNAQHPAVASRPYYGHRGPPTRQILEILGSAGQHLKYFREADGVLFRYAPFHQVEFEFLV